MDTPPTTNQYKNHRFPVEIISPAVWLYFRFCLSFRDVEEVLWERGGGVTYEAIRKWCRRCGQQYANQLRCQRPRPGDKWHMAEMVLAILVHRRRHKRAAQKFFRTLLKGLTDGPRVILTAKLKSYGAAKRSLLPGVDHRHNRYLNNRAENSHQPTPQHERRRQRLKSPGQAQRFLSAYGPIAQHFRPRRPRLSARVSRQE
jgi:putative transposase